MFARTGLRPQNHSTVVWILSSDIAKDFATLRFNTSLNIHGSNRVGFFPGAIAALRGRNGGGGWFLVSEVLSVGENLQLTPITLTINPTAAAYECSTPAGSVPYS